MQTRVDTNGQTQIMVKITRNGKYWFSYLQWEQTAPTITDYTWIS